MSAQDLFQNILDNPDDDAARLVYADWLEEHGDMDRAEFIRLQFELLKLPSNSQEALLKRERELLATHEKKWLAAYATREPGLLEGVRKGQLKVLRKIVSNWQFRRGFVEGATILASQFLQRGEELFLLVPTIQNVWLRGLRDFDAAGLIPALTSCRLLEKLTVLDLRNTKLSPVNLIHLIESPHLRNLTSLRLSFNGLGRRLNEFQYLLAAVSSLENFPRLTTLELMDNEITDEGAAFFAAYAGLDRLTSIRLEFNPIRAAARAMLTARFGKRVIVFPAHQQIGAE